MNQAVNFFWTILGFAPVITYWMGADSLLWCYIFIGVSVLSLLFPTRFLQFSNSPKFYEALGVKKIRMLVQNGDLVNRLIRKTKPYYRVIGSYTNSAGYIKTTIMYERYHFLCSVFFLLTAINCFVNDSYWLSAVIVLANIIYNVCPILLQQYNRVRIQRLTGKK